MEQGLFFPSKNGDRKYKASDFTGYFSHLFSNGVFSNNSENLQVLASKTNGLAVVVRGGYGHQINPIYNWFPSVPLDHNKKHQVEAIQGLDLELSVGYSF